MIEAMLIFVFIFLFAGLRQIGRFINQERYEKERFSLLVAQELDRLDKAIRENNNKIEQAESMLVNEEKWWGRN